MIAMLFALALQSTQTDTDCIGAGQTTSCVSRTQPAPPNVGQQMLDNMARQNQASANRDAAAANERRAAAYNRVADLIAKGDCDGARKLAAFYNHRDIIKDTARACPEK